MRTNTLILATAAVMAFGATAHSQSPMGPPDTGTQRTTEGAPGQKQNSNNPTAGQKNSGTTGQGIGGNVGSNAQQPGGTNNEQTGTQSHDAQKGGSGSHGAR